MVIHIRAERVCAVQATPGLRCSVRCIGLLIQPVLTSLGVFASVPQTAGVVRTTIFSKASCSIPARLPADRPCGPRCASNAHTAALRPAPRGRSPLLVRCKAGRTVRCIAATHVMHYIARSVPPLG